MVASSFCHDRKSAFGLQLHGAIYRLDSFVLMPRYCVNLKAIRYESTSLNRIVADKSHRVIVALDRQIGMEPLVINWVNEEANMAKIIRHFYVIANNSIFRSIMQYFFNQINSAEGVYLMMNSEKKFIVPFLKYP